MKISVVIPNFNSSKLLKDNLPKVFAAVKDSEVIVVDDASTDDSLTMLKTYFPKVKVIARGKNEGFASTVNIGVKEAEGDLIVLLNTDVVPEENFLDKAIEHFRNPMIFAVGFLQKCPENGKVILRGRGVGKFEKGFLIHDRGAVIGEDTSEVAEWTPRMVEELMKTLWVSGGAGIFRKSIWEKLGGLDTLYNPFYWEDIDLSYRALKAGYKLVFEPKSVVMHNQEKGAIRNLYTPGQVKTIAYRNQILFVWLNITDFSLLRQHLLYLPIHLLKALVIFDFAFVQGFLQAILKIPYIFIYRNKNKS